MSTGLILTSGGLALLRDFLAASRNDMAPQPPAYIVFGSGVNPVNRFMNQVPGETFRGQITNRTVLNESVIFSTFLGTADNPNQTIGSVGIVAGDATAQLGSGDLIAIMNWPTPFAKDATNTFAPDLVITISGNLT